MLGVLVFSVRLFGSGKGAVCLEVYCDFEFESGGRRLVVEGAVEGTVEGTVERVFERERAAEVCDEMVEEAEENIGIEFWRESVGEEEEGKDDLRLLVGGVALGEV